MRITIELYGQMRPLKATTLIGELYKRGNGIEEAETGITCQGGRGLVNCKQVGGEK